MTDKKLLELAAKAAGITWIRDYKDGPMKVMMPFTREWNPLTDDGDALRLAVKLRIIVDVRYGGEESHLEFNEVCYWVEKGRPYKVMKFEKGIDPYAATRRAIVRAAAEIGRTL